MQPFIDVKALARIKDLPLLAKTVAQGFLHGLHTSLQRGSGIEFSQYRAYEPGDSLAKIDWKLFARSDRYFVREAERESQLNVWLVLDASESMLHSTEGGASGSINKLDYGRYLLATLGYLAQQQGDNLGLLALSGNQTAYVAANNGQRHFQKVLLELARVQSSGVFPSLTAVQNKLSGLRQNGLIFIVSDFYQRNNELLEFAGNLANTKTDVVAIQLTSEEELTFPHRGAVRFEDLETRQRLQVSATQIRAHYLKAQHQFQQDLEQHFSAARIQHLKVKTEQPLEQVLYDFLMQRSKAG